MIEDVDGVSTSADYSSSEDEEEEGNEEVVAAVRVQSSAADN